MAHTITLIPGDGIGPEVPAIMMLRHLGEAECAGAVRQAMVAVLAAGKVRTRDLGGSSTTTEFADAICHQIEHKGGAPSAPA